MERQDQSARPGAQRPGRPASARAQAEALLSAETLGQIFHASPSAMLLVAADGTMQLANAEAERLFGYGPGELAGRSVECLVPAHFRDQHPALRQTYLRSPSVRAMGEGRDLFGLRRDGTEVPIEIGLNPIEAGGASFTLAAIIDISQRKRSEDMLRASLREKDTLLREIHHRVKNNMQVVSSLLNLQLDTVDDSRHRTMIEECQSRIRAMALIHEKLYSAGNLSALDGAEYTRSLVQMLVRSYVQSGSNVRTQVDVQPIELTIQTAIPVGLILHELVTNAIKHAFVGRDGGTLTVRAASEAGRGRLEVADDGVGLPAGLDPSRSRGLGFRLIAGLVRQIDGSLCIERDGGSRFVIEFEQRAHAGPLPPASPQNGG